MCLFYVMQYYFVPVVDSVCRSVVCVDGVCTTTPVLEQTQGAKRLNTGLHLRTQKR